MTERPIKVSYVHPPIPTREFDYCATFEGYEPGDPQGWGATPESAKTWLLIEVDEREAA